MSSDGFSYSHKDRETQKPAELGGPLLAENADAMIESIRKNLQESKEVLNENGTKTYSLRCSRRY
jgi:hypothetical protein